MCFNCLHLMRLLNLTTAVIVHCYYPIIIIIIIIYCSCAYLFEDDTGGTILSQSACIPLLYVPLELSLCQHPLVYPCHSLKLPAYTFLLCIIIISFQPFYSQQTTQSHIRSVISSGHVGYYKGVEGWHQVVPALSLWLSAPQAIDEPVQHPPTNPVRPQTPLQVIDVA